MVRFHTFQRRSPQRGDRNSFCLNSMTAIGITLIVLGAVVSAINWFTLIATARSGRFVSAVPLIGAGLLGSGMSIVPQTRSYAWVALIADYGTLALLLVLPRLVLEGLSVSRFNLLHSFQIDEDGRRIEIQLFRRNIAIIRGDFNPPVPCDDAGSLAVSFSWLAKWQPAEDGFSITDYGSGRELKLSQENGHFRTRELKYLGNSKHKHNCLDGLKLQLKNKA